MFGILDDILGIMNFIVIAYIVSVVIFICLTKIIQGVFHDK